MLQKSHYLLLLVFGFLTLNLSAQKPITLEDIWQNGTFQAKGIPGFNFQKDGVHYTRLSADGSKIEQFDLRSGNQSGVLFDAATVSTTAPGWSGKFDGYSFSGDESKILLTTATEGIYRWSSKSQFFVFDPQKKTLTRVHEGSKQRYTTFSPDAGKVAFECDNDLYIKDLATGKETRVTNDGKKNSIINGASDWVYEEEFELVRAFEWSPDGQRLAYLRFDESAVPEMVMETYNGGPRPDSVAFKYPKVGEPNSTVTAHIFDLKSSRTTAVSTGAAADDYLPRLTWTPGGQLCLTRLNRHQNELWLLLADPATGQCKTLLDETSKYYVDLKEPHFLADGSGFVWESERSGFNHLYRHDMAGKEVAALTKGKFDVTNFYGLDEKNGLAYYQTASVNPMQREIFSVNLKGKKAKQVSATGLGAGFHNAQFSSTFDYWVNSYSTLNSPPQYAVRDRKGNIVRQLEQNTALRDKQSEFGTVPAEFFQFKTSADVQLNGWMMKPRNIPEGEKLPVLMFVYGGPGSQQVLDQWKGANYWWFQMLVQQGYVVACVDNRGTGARGEEFKKQTYLQLGKLETEDQIESGKYIGTLPFVDKERIGIFGWSYGGYMSSLCLFKGKEVFEAAIAVAPVTNWKWYDSAYTERYMRTHEENPQGYEENSPVNFADQLEGKYLLVHGLADDNVHFQHSAEMANQLIANNKQFDAMIYPNRNHGISDKAAKMHLYTLMTDFLNEKLKGKNTVVKP